MSKTVATVRPEVATAIGDWELIRACVEGERAVKKLGDKVLPRPNPTDTSKENVARFNAYMMRAVWYNVTGRTLEGLVGYVFSKEPTVTLPDTMAILETDVDGTGTSIHQQAKKALGRVLSFGRCGLFVDYPTGDGAPVSRKDLQDGKVRPTICFYEPEQIINWKLATVGAQTVLVLLVLRETYAKVEDEFCDTLGTRYRVLELKGNVYTVRLFDEDGTLLQTYVPQDASGSPITSIPFLFVGSETNDSTLDRAPLQDLAFLNLAHFRNSADYEEASFLVGQPTPWLAGLTESWVKDIMKGKLNLGSRGAILLPVGGSAGLLQAEPNTMPKEAMEHKERQMVALGAKLVEAKEVQRTATEAGLEHASEASMLTAAANNVFAAYLAALKLCGLFVGSTATDLAYDLSEPLVLTALAPDQATALISLLQAGLIDYEEARWTVKKGGMAWKDDEEVRENNAADMLVPTGKPDPQPDPAPGNEPPTA